ncbi:MAG: BON domain-containing protein [Caldilineaceae bacterium]|nr:BON domain-containing protein [Caldilineaceae bacterium]
MAEPDLNTETTVSHRTARSDTELLEAVRRSLRTVMTSAFRAVTPSVTGGEVTLTGIVPSKAARLHAEELARLVPNVVSVRNNLVVDESRRDIWQRF